jgi:uncharacterized protein (DUF2141 family)
MSRTFALVVHGLVVALAAAQPELRVEVLLNKPDAGGLLRVLLCPTKEAFDTEHGCRSVQLEATTRTIRCVFDSVPPGTYAVKAHHDINADGLLNTSWVGWPLEPYGFSNDAPVNAGPPPFRLAAITLGEQRSTVRIRLR